MSRLIGELGSMRRRSGRQMLLLAALVVVSTACGAVRFQTFPEPPEEVPPDFDPTDADVRSWASGDCHGDCCVGLVGVVGISEHDGVDWVLLENATARRVVIEDRVTDGRSNAIVPASEIDRVLSGGTAAIGVGIAVERLAATAEALAAGADLVVASIAIGRDQPADPEPQTGFGAILPDGRFAWIGCSPSLTDEVNSYLRETAVTDPSAEIERLFANDADAVERFRRWTPGRVDENG